MRPVLEVGPRGLPLMGRIRASAPKTSATTMTNANPRASEVLRVSETNAKMGRVKPTEEIDVLRKGLGERQPQRKSIGQAANDRGEQHGQLHSQQKEEHLGSEQIAAPDGPDEPILADADDGILMNQRWR